MSEPKEPGIHPALAAVILIVVTVAVCIAVAAWMGLISFTWFADYEPQDVVFSDNFSNQSRVLSQLNITIVNGKVDYLRHGELHNRYVFTQSKFDEFLRWLDLYKITFIATDYQPYEIPRHMEQGVLYVLDSYHFWFYIDTNDIGLVQIVYAGYEEAWLP